MQPHATTPTDGPAQPNDGAPRTTFSMPGMDCPVEEAMVRDALKSLAGVFRVECDLLGRRVAVWHAPAALPAVAAALEGLNMGARQMNECGNPPASPQGAFPWRRLAVAGALALLAEFLDLWLEWRGGLGGITAQTRPGGLPLAPLLPLAPAVAAIAVSGVETFRKGWSAALHGTLNMNALMSVAVTGAVCIGQYPEAAVVMTLFALSEAIEGKAMDKARDAVRKLLALAPDTALVRQDDGSWREADSRQVPVGSRVRVRPGEKIALDGVVVAGASAVNQAPITGESMPVEKAVGDVVYAGTLNTHGEMEFTVTAAARDTTLARILHAVEEAQTGRAPMQRLVDAFARLYTPAVFAVALLTALILPLALGRLWGEAAYTALTVLVIGCPCALVISTPVTIVGGLAAAARHGILIKGGVFLEQGRKLAWLALDKTGTLTSGTPRQTDFLVLNGTDPARAARLAAGLAAHSDHPVSRALSAHAAAEGIAPLPVADFSAVPGQGVRGSVDGQTWHLCSPARLRSLGWGDAGLAARVRVLEEAGKSVTVLAGPNGPAALLAVADSLREGGLAAMRDLKALGVRTVMLSGDNAAAVRAVARQSGVDEAHGGLMPDDKLRFVERLEARGGVVGMAGDGVNDAPALARAHIGFALARDGADTALETADVALMDGDLRKIPRFIRLSRATCAILWQNIALALAVKALCFVLTFAGLASMWMAVFADVGATLLVVANGLRALRQ